MKKQFSKFGLACFIFLSVFCVCYLNKAENNTGNVEISQYEEFTNSTDRMISQVRSATLVVHRVIDFLTNRELS